jgi:hypothetical protein
MVCRSWPYGVVSSPPEIGSALISWKPLKSPLLYTTQNKMKREIPFRQKFSDKALWRTLRKGVSYSNYTSFVKQFLWSLCISVLWLDAVRGTSTSFTDILVSAWRKITNWDFICSFVLHS